MGFQDVFSTTRNTAKNLLTQPANVLKRSAISWVVGLCPYNVLTSWLTSIAHNRRHTKNKSITGLETTKSRAQTGMKMNRTSYESYMSSTVITVDVYLFTNFNMSETWTIPCVEHIPDAEELEQMFQDLENNKLPTLQWKNPGRKLPEGNWLCEPHAWTAG